MKLFERYRRMITRNPIIQIDRNIPLDFRFWTEKIVHPEIQESGPDSFDIRKLTRHRIPGHNDWCMRGEPIYEYYLENNLLAKTVGLREFRQLRRYGPRYYNHYLKGVIIFGWKSIVLNRSGSLFVPFLCCRDDQNGMVLDWCWIGNSNVIINSDTLFFPE